MLWILLLLALGLSALWYGADSTERTEISAERSVRLWAGRRAGSAAGFARVYRSTLAQRRKAGEHDRPLMSRF